MLVEFFKQFREARCIRTHQYEGIQFNEGNIYPIIGSNNGQQLAYCDKNGDTQIRYLFNGIDNLLFDLLDDEYCFIEV